MPEGCQLFVGDPCLCVLYLADNTELSCCWRLYGRRSLTEYKREEMETRLFKKWENIRCALLGFGWGNSAAVLHNSWTHARAFGMGRAFTDCRGQSHGKLCFTWAEKLTAGSGNYAGSGNGKQPFELLSSSLEHHFPSSTCFPASSFQKFHKY